MLITTGAVEYRVRVKDDEGTSVMDRQISAFKVEDRKQQLQVDQLNAGSSYYVEIASVDALDRHSKTFSDLEVFTTSKFNLKHVQVYSLVTRLNVRENRFSILKLKG